MKTIDIKSIHNTHVMDALNQFFQGQLTEDNGEIIVTFNNEHGKGTIRTITFNWGVSLIDYDIKLIEDCKIVFHISKVSPLEFVFVSEGTIQYSATNPKNLVVLERYQNVIISNKLDSKNTFVFPKETVVKVNMIHILKSEFKKKKNNNLDSLQESILSIFRMDKPSKAYQHLGNYNLAIADYIKHLNKAVDAGIVRALTIEGQLNLILALQLLEHKNFENKTLLPDSISKDNIKKIHKLTDYILDNISEPMTIEGLSKQSGLTPKKLQMGFRLLYSKSVNEYIRQLKLELARDYIKNTELTISEIVYSIGYRSRSYFSKVFFENYGILPMEYRDNLKKIGEL